MRNNGWAGDPIDVVRMPDGGLTTITKEEARVREHSLICVYIIEALLNARYEIAKKNIGQFEAEISRATSLLKVPEANLFNLVNRLEW